MKKLYIAALAACLGMAAPGLVAAAPAASPVELNSTVKVVRTVTENGVSKTVLSDPKVVVPGDRLVFSNSYRNTGTKPIKSFVITNQVPQSVVLADDGAGALTVSVDRAATWGKLAALTVADGKGGRRAAVAADVTHIRWTVPVIAPGTGGTVTYNAIIR